MGPSRKRWNDLPDPDPRPLFRTAAAQSQVLHFSFEKAGLTLREGPIPWNADAVTVEAIVRVPTISAEVRDAFSLHLPGREPIAAEALRPAETSGQARLFFRFAVPPKTVFADLRWRERSLGQLTLPVLPQAAFLDQLQLVEGTIHVRLGTETRVCRGYVTTQAKELYASAILRSPTSLVPLADLVLAVEVIERSGTVRERHEAFLSSGQLAGTQALVMTPLRKPRGSGRLIVRWTVAGESRFETPLQGLTLPAFRRSLRLSATRFLLEPREGAMPLARFAPPTLEGIERIGPVFLVTSGAEGMAAVAEFRVRVLDAVGGTVLEMPTQTVVLSDGPAVIAPGTLAKVDLENAYAFELLYGEHRLGLLSVAPVPSAAFDAEGGFAVPDGEFAWSPSAEEQLHDRLGRLLG